MLSFLLPDWRRCDGVTGQGVVVKPLESRFLKVVGSLASLQGVDGLLPIFGHLCFHHGIRQGGNWVTRGLVNQFNSILLVSYNQQSLYKTSFYTITKIKFCISFLDVS